LMGKVVKLKRYQTLEKSRRRCLGGDLELFKFDGEMGYVLLTGV